MFEKLIAKAVATKGGGKGLLGVMETLNNQMKLGIRFAKVENTESAVSGSLRQFVSSIEPSVGKDGSEFVVAATEQGGRSMRMYLVIGPVAPGSVNS